MKKEYGMFFLGGLLALSLSGCSGKGEVTHTLEPTDTTLLAFDSFEARDSELTLKGEQLYDGSIILSDSEKESLDSGATIKGMYEKTELFTLTKGDDSQYELKQTNGDSERVDLQQTDGGWKMVEAVGGLDAEIVLDADFSYAADWGTEITVENYYAYVTGEYPKDESEKVWTLQQFYDDYLSKAEIGEGEIRITESGDSVQMEEIYNP